MLDGHLARPREGTGRMPIQRELVSGSEGMF